MYKYLLFLCLIFLPVISQASTIPELIATEAVKQGVDPKLALYISYKESGWNTDAVGDKGTSFGLFQLHDPESKGISIAQAEDPTFAIQWSIKQLKEGHCAIWSTCPISE